MGVGFVPVTTRGPTDQSAQASGSPSQSGKHARLDALRARYEHDAPHAPFISEFTSIVFGDGDPDAALMFVGEAPGADEDREGVPFVGRAGQLLNKMIAAMGLSRDRVYIANVLKVRPPNNATPTPDEIDASRPYLLEQIDIVAPHVIVALGLPAAKCLLGVNDSMASLRARFHPLHTPGGLHIPVMPTYHPAFLLRSYTPENRGKVWSDLQMVMDHLGLQQAPERG
jgi:DNA polymerase